MQRNARQGKACITCPCKLTVLYLWYMYNLSKLISTSSLSLSSPPLPLHPLPHSSTFPVKVTFTTESELPLSTSNCPLAPLPMPSLPPSPIREKVFCRGTQPLSSGDSATPPATPPATQTLAIWSSITLFSASLKYAVAVRTSLVRPPTGTGYGTVRVP